VAKNFRLHVLHIVAVHFWEPYRQKGLKFPRFGAEECILAWSTIFHGFRKETRSIGVHGDVDIGVSSMAFAVRWGR
jgi:hypothetical protein